MPLTFAQFEHARRLEVCADYPELTNAEYRAVYPPGSRFDKGCEHLKQQLTEGVPLTGAQRRSYRRATGTEPDRFERLYEAR